MMAPKPSVAITRPVPIVVKTVPYSTKSRIVPNLLDAAGESLNHSPCSVRSATRPIECTK